MEEAVVEVLEGGTDLTPVLDAMEMINGSLQQLQANTDYILLGIFLLAGVVVGCCIGWLLHDLWRA